MNWILRIATLLALAAAASAQGGALGCAVGRGGGTDGVSDGCYGDVSLDYEVDSPLHGTGRVRFTDGTGSSPWVAATPHPTAGCTDSQATTTSDGGDPPTSGGTYRVRNGKVEKRNGSGRWVELPKRVKPSDEELDALAAAYAAAGGVIDWIELDVVPATASSDGQSFEPLRSTPGGTADRAPFALGYASGVGWSFLAPGDFCADLAVVVVGDGEGTLPAGWTFWTVVQ